MKILAVEFSSEQRSVAVMDGAAADSPKLLGESSELGGRRALSLVDEALQRAKFEREEIDCIAVGLGPGSYTGIRGSIALAQGWQLGREVKLLGISSVEVLAAQAQTDKIFGEINIVIDAQRNEFYLARYKISSNGVRESECLRLASFAEVEERSKTGQLIIGPDITRCFSSAKNIFPAAAQLGFLAAARNDFSSGEKLEPIYLREVAFKKAPPSRVIN